MFFCWGVCFGVGVFVTKLGCGVDRTRLKRLFTRCNRIISIGVVVSERANHSGKCNFIRVTSSRTKSGTVTTLGRISVSKGALSISMTHPERRHPHHDCNGGNNNNCHNNGGDHNNNCNNDHKSGNCNNNEGEC